MDTTFVAIDDRDELRRQTFRHRGEPRGPFTVGADVRWHAFRAVVVDAQADATVPGGVLVGISDDTWSTIEWVDPAELRLA